MDNYKVHLAEDLGYCDFLFLQNGQTGHSSIPVIDQDRNLSFTIVELQKYS